MESHRCEACEGQVEKSCGYGDVPILDLCTEHYIEHLEGAHPKNRMAQIEARLLRSKLKRHERDLVALLQQL